MSMCSKFFVFFLTKNSRFVVDLKLSKLNQVKVPLFFFFPCITSVCLQNCGVRELYFLHSFSPWNPAIHDEAREKMLTQKKPEDQHCKSMHVSGLSWVKPGSVQPFSKEEKTMPT